MNGRGFPPMSLVLAGAFIAAHLALMAAPAGLADAIYYACAVIPARFDPASELAFAHWYEAAGPLFGHVFLHAGWPHLGMNTLAFIQAAPLVERRIGAFRLLALFFASAAAGALLYVTLNLGARSPAIGASGAVCGVFGAYFLSVRSGDWRAALAEPAVRNGAAVFLLVNVGLAALARMTGFIPIAWEAHLGGFIGGAAAYVALAPRRIAGAWG